MHMLNASTLTHGLNDSPIGIRAWLLQRWQKWSDKNAGLDAVSYREFVLTQAVAEPPAGCAFLLGDVHSPGRFGHFENPEALAGDVRETLRKLR
ncbi:hypothetical protein OH779_06885 [Actinacidiphila glaucinigra]|uniref:hypothetical protein n=1 Tax=Actinacidiphila glaucinigra TaxID=235986 RepID=UPI0038709076